MNRIPLNRLKIMDILTLSNLLLILMCVSSCRHGVVNNSTTDVGEKSPTEVAASIGELDLNEVSPVEFLKYLEDSYIPPDEYKSVLAHFYLIFKCPENWITESDVKELEKYINDSRPCRPVVSAFSSHLPEKNSTVGHEARYLIEGYFKGRYPHELVSTAWQSDDNR